MKLKVWAPKADLVERITGDEAFPLEKDGEYWVGQISKGSDYKLRVDGAGPFPDPRSKFQPEGVHGPSRAVDLSFDWTDQDWRGPAGMGGVWYELHVGTFTEDGTLDSARARLQHLKDLGVGTIELMPVAAFPGKRGWGYDGVSLYAVHETYGGPRALQRFVDAAHNLGIAVALDVVYNHMGPSGNYTHPFGPYFTGKHETPWGEAVNLDDVDSHGMRGFIVDNARQWLVDFHLDALRLDAVHALVDDSEQHILAELAEKKEQWQDEVGRSLLLVAESDLNDVKLLKSPKDGGYGLDGQWDDDFHHALHSYLTGETFGYYKDFGSAEALADVFENVFLHRGNYSSFRGKDWGAPVPGDMDRRRFLSFTQNHDQVGNRALGDRPEASLEVGQVMAGAALLLLGPFTPMLFQGQEFASSSPFMFFTDHDGDVAELISKGRLTEFSTHGWEVLYGETFTVPDPQDETTFVKSKLDFDEALTKPHSEVLEGYTALIALRTYIENDPHTRASFGDGWFKLERSRITVLTNTGEDASTHVLPAATQTAPRQAGNDANAPRLLWQWGDVSMDTPKAGEQTLTLGAHSVAVVLN